MRLFSNDFFLTQLVPNENLRKNFLHSESTCDVAFYDVICLNKDGYIQMNSLVLLQDRILFQRLCSIANMERAVSSRIWHLGPGKQLSLWLCCANTLLCI